MIIGICGRARSGKDTIASYISEHYGFEHKSFASSMKDAAKIIFGWTDDHVNGALKEVIDLQYGISPRQFLQAIGTDFAQHMLCEKYPGFAATTGRALWVNRLISASHGLPVVVSDVRFAHEATAIQKSGGVVIRVRRECADSQPVTHESEADLCNILPDYELQNNGTIIDLYAMAKRIMSDITNGILAGNYGDFG